jgi:hypothetical protein
VPDQEQSTEVPQSPSPPVVSEVFRESFIAIFDRDDHAGAIRLLGKLAHDLVFESRELLESPGKPGDPIWRADIQGAIGDLRQAANQLADVARDLDEAGNGGRHTVRVMLAIADATNEVAPIADRLDAALAAYLASPPAE